MITLPDKFTEKMQRLLGKELEDFLSGYDTDKVQGLRLNRLKNNGETDLFLGGFSLTPIPWCPDGFYYREEDRPGRHPYHEAGAYYIQEPSAMAVVELLSPKPQDVVLDLCAAPGGKTSHIASKLMGQGFLLSNEIHPARAKILSQNVERMGMTNCVVTNETPERLADHFPEFFDKIVTDAPCSGEGMFRKDENAVAQWSPENVELCARRQQDILNQAALMLKPGGLMVYSTCTFSPEENEGTIETFIKEHPEFTIKDVTFYSGFDRGRPEWIKGEMEELKHTFRIWPHKVNGEGHFLALLEKEGREETPRKRLKPSFVKDKEIIGEIKEFAKQVLVPGHICERGEGIIAFGDQIYQLPEQMLSLSGLKVLRPGLHLGERKKNRFEPSHALALSLDISAVRQYYEMSREETQSYLAGEALAVCLPKPGWTLMLTGGYSIGWSKSASGMLKNHYPKGLRCRMSW